MHLITERSHSNCLYKSSNALNPQQKKTEKLTNVYYLIKY